MKIIRRQSVSQQDTQEDESEIKMSDEQCDVKIGGQMYCFNKDTTFRLFRDDEDESDLYGRRSEAMSVPVVAGSGQPSVDLMTARVSQTRRIEFVADEEEFLWLEIVNERRGSMGLSEVSMDVVERLLDDFEQMCYIPFTGLPPAGAVIGARLCVVCLEKIDRSGSPLVACVKCDINAHQNCVGICEGVAQFWVCSVCCHEITSRPVPVCRLCPRSADQNALFERLARRGEWVHVVCALAIDELHLIRSPATPQPLLDLRAVKPTRFEEECAVCKRTRVGACVQCSDEHCSVNFHATCAQSAGFKMRFENYEVGRGQKSARIYFKCAAHSGDQKEIRDRSNRYKTQIGIVKETVYPRIDPTDLDYIKANARELVPEGNFFDKIYTYWKFRRVQSNGEPLIRRLILDPNTRQCLADDRDKSTEYGGKYEEPETNNIEAETELTQEFEQDSNTMRAKNTNQQSEQATIRFNIVTLKHEALCKCIRACLNQMENKNGSKFFNRVSVTTHDGSCGEKISIDSMQQKLDHGEYTAYGQFQDDYGQMMSDWIVQNGEGHPDIDEVEAFHKAMKIYMSRKRTKFLKDFESDAAIRTSLINSQFKWPFRKKLSSAMRKKAQPDQTQLDDMFGVRSAFEQETSPTEWYAANDETPPRTGITQEELRDEETEAAINRYFSMEHDDMEHF